MKDKDIYKPIGEIMNMLADWRIKYDHVVGVGIAISHKKKVIYKESFGFSDLENNKKFKTNTLFPVASISKMFTAVGVLQLVENNKISLDSRVSDYIKEFKIKDLRHITIRHLLAHQGGVFRDSNKSYWTDNVFTNNVLNDVVKETKTINNLSCFKYSNFGFAILGKVIEAVSGEKYGNYVYENIIKKLDLKNTHPDYSKKLDQKLALGYTRFIVGEKRTAFKNSPALDYAPATGFVSTIEDLLVFLDDISSKHSKLLPDHLLREMSYPLSKTIDDSEYGLGLEIEHINGNRLIGHTGGHNGYMSLAFSVPEKEMSVVVLINNLGGKTRSFGFNVFRLYDWFKNIPVKKRKISSLSKYEGVYRNHWGDTCIVAAGENLIVFSPDDNNPFSEKTHLTPLGNNKFIIKNDTVFGVTGEEASFSDIKNGMANKLIFGGSISQRLK